MYYFDKLCFEGCGIFAIIYVGAITYLEKHDLLHQVHEFSGTSSGSIIATMLALEYTATEIFSLFNQLDWNKFYDYNIGFFNFFSDFGIYKGKKLHELYKSIIKNKTNSENTTFKQLFDMNGNKLYICAVNLSTQESIYFSVDTHPDMEIHLALRFSTSFPFIFKSLKYKDDYYVDGGVMDNYPMEVFEDSSCALGFNLETNVNKKEKINNIFGFAKNIISAMTKSQNHLELHPYRDKTISIYNDADSLLTSVLDIGDIKDKAENYFNLGYSTTKKFIENNPTNVSEHGSKQESHQEDH